MEINTFCPECENGIFLHEMPKAGLIPCKRCGKGREAVGNGELDPHGAISRCGFCGCLEFYQQKDFNTKLGLWIAALVLGLALALLLLNHIKTGFGILIGGTLLDTVLYFGLGNIVICYNCRAIYRDMPISPKIGGFELKIHDEYVFKGKK